MYIRHNLSDLHLKHITNMPTNYSKSGLFLTAAIALLTGCNTTPTNQPTTAATTTPTSTPTSTPTPTVTTTSSPTDVNEPSERKKAIESSGKVYLSALSKGQQAFFLEKNKFSGTIDDLGIGIKAEDNNYLLKIVDAQPKSVTMTATAKQDNVKSFAVSVFAVGNANNEITISIVCGTDTPSEKPPTGISAPKSETETPTCPTGSSPVEK